MRKTHAIPLQTLQLKTPKLTTKLERYFHANVAQLCVNEMLGVLVKKVAIHFSGERVRRGRLIDLVAQYAPFLIHTMINKCAMKQDNIVTLLGVLLSKNAEGDTPFALVCQGRHTSRLVQSLVLRLSAQLLVTVDGASLFSCVVACCDANTIQLALRFLGARGRATAFDATNESAAELLATIASKSCNLFLWMLKQDGVNCYLRAMLSPVNGVRLIDRMLQPKTSDDVSIMLRQLDSFNLNVLFECLDEPQQKVLLDGVKQNTPVFIGLKLYRARTYKEFTEHVNKLKTTARSMGVLFPCVAEKAKLAKIKLLTLCITLMSQYSGRAMFSSSSLDSDERLLGLVLQGVVSNSKQVVVDADVAGRCGDVAKTLIQACGIRVGSPRQQVATNLSVGGIFEMAVLNGPSSDAGSGSCASAKASAVQVATLS